MISFYVNFSIFGILLPFQLIASARERQRMADKHISMYVGKFYIR